MNNNANIHTLHPDTPLSFMTYGQLQDMVKQIAEEVARKCTEASEEAKKHRVAHSIAELAEYLGCCPTTAVRLKKGCLAPLVKQLPDSRLFSIDVDEAFKVLRKNYG